MIASIENRCVEQSGHPCLSGSGGHGRPRLGRSRGLAGFTDESQIGCGQFHTQQMPAPLNWHDRWGMLIGSVYTVTEGSGLTQSCQHEEEGEQLGPN